MRAVFEFLFNFFGNRGVVAELKGQALQTKALTLIEQAAKLRGEEGTKQKACIRPLRSLGWKSMRWKK